MRTALFGCVFGFASSPAFAEVCDKVRPLWDGDQVGQLEELFHMLASPAGVVIVVLLIAAVSLRRMWFSIPVALALFGLSAVIFLDWFWLGDGIAYAAYREGCMGGVHLTVACLILAAVTLVLWTRRVCRMATV